MRALLLGLAASAAAILAAPAAAENSDHMAFVAKPATSFHGGFGGGRNDRGFGRHRGGDDGAVLYYDRDYQGDTAWRSDSFNDWWHDRPDRAYPRWMMSNQNCDRMWWSGGAFHC